jgi:hypothetical protein
MGSTGRPPNQGGASGSGQDDAGAGGGSGGADASAGWSYPPVTCVVGQTYCAIYGQNDPTLPSQPECETVKAACATDPSCACIGFFGLKCTCADADGFTTATCLGI